MRGHHDNTIHDMFTIGIAGHGLHGNWNASYTPRGAYTRRPARVCPPRGRSACPATRQHGCMQQSMHLVR